MVMLIWVKEGFECDDIGSLMEFSVFMLFIFVFVIIFGWVIVMF